MFKYLFVLIFLFGVFNSAAQGECISGDCDNGWGKYEDTEWGTFYDGMWQDGAPYGWGSMIEGDVLYSGIFIEGTPHYFGTYFWEDGSFFMGLVDQGDRLENGIYVDENGNPEFKNEAFYFEGTGCVYGDCNDGLGVYRFPSGGLAISIFEEGEIHGFGAYFFEEEYYWGLFDKGEIISTGLYVGEDGAPRYLPNKKSWAIYESGRFSYGSDFGNSDVWVKKSSSAYYFGSMRYSGLYHYFGAYFWNAGDFYLGLWRRNKYDIGGHQGIYIDNKGRPTFHTQPFDLNTLRKW